MTLFRSFNFETHYDIKACNISFERSYLLVHTYAMKEGHGCDNSIHRFLIHNIGSITLAMPWGTTAFCIEIMQSYVGNCP